MYLSKKNQALLILPIMLCFFTMGFVDLVGIASNYVKADLHLTDAEANIFPSLVFFWFLIFSVPTGMLMNRIGRKWTVLISVAITVVALFIPLFGDNYWLMLVAFSLLGIGNAIMQTSLNPLLSTVVRGNHLSSMLTFGQFIKAIASFLAPIIAVWGATHDVLGLGWQVLFPIYMVFAALAMLVLGVTPIEEEQPDRASGLKDCFVLLGRPFVLLCFLSIMCHVGIDVGTNTTAPKFLQSFIGMDLKDAGFATSLYFIFRTFGCFTGTFILRRVTDRTFFAVSVGLMVLAMLGLGIFHASVAVLYVSIALIGYGNSNIFSITFAQALKACPDKKNEVSGLMIMGLIGGAVFPLVMGLVSDVQATQVGAVIVMSVAVAYLLFFLTRIK